MAKLWHTVVRRGRTTAFDAVEVGLTVFGNISLEGSEDNDH